MKYLEFYEKLHFEELEKRDQINNSIALPIGLITAGVTILVFFFSNFDLTVENASTIFFQILCFLTFLSLFLAIIFLTGAYNNWFFGHDYFDLSYGDKLHKYHQSLIDFYFKLDDTGHKKKANKKFLEFLKRKYIECQKTNARTNDLKRKWFYNGISFVIAAYFFIFISAIPFYINLDEAQSKTKVTEIKLNGQIDYTQELINIQNSIDSLNSKLN